MLSSSSVETVLIGCGAPLSGMGWWHALQLLDGKVPSANLKHVVEPFMLGAGKASPGGVKFAEFAADPRCEGVSFTRDLGSLPKPAGPRLALISGRTGDNPRLLSEAIAAGCTTVYLEKPGAPSVPELEAMAEEARGKGVRVLMGYNKNVAKYVRKVRDFAATAPAGSTVTFVSNNAYENSPESLGECFERNAEGMLKNMAIHELALLVSFYDVTVDTIKSVEADRGYSSVQTLKGPSGKDWT
ncbi:hypothetical protein TeGR_g15099, partial [Tetraparma gracilis]